jgi:hypothetical protein
VSIMEAVNPISSRKLDSLVNQALGTCFKP